MRLSQKMRIGLCAVALALSACAAPRSVSEPIPFTADQGGIQLSNAAERIDFGRTDHSVLPAMNKLAGRGPISQSVCGDLTRVDWPTIALFFRGGDFRGWETAEANVGVSCR